MVSGFFVLGGGGSGVCVGGGGGSGVGGFKCGMTGVQVCGESNVGGEGGFKCGGSRNKCFRGIDWKS